MKDKLKESYNNGWNDAIEEAVKIALDSPLEERYIASGNYSGNGLSKLLLGIRSLSAAEIGKLRRKS